MSWILSVDIGGTSFKAQAQDNQGSRSPVFQQETGSTDPENVLMAIMAHMAELKDSLKGDCLGIAGGFPGIVSSDSTILGSPHLPNWQGINLTTWFLENTQCPSIWTNDPNLAAYAELTTPAGLQSINLVMLTLGTGVGAGIILNRSIYSGSGFAGEAGHITVDPKGIQCACGRVGCLETVFSKLGLERAMTQSLGQILPGGVPELFEAAQDKQHPQYEKATDILRIAFDQFAVGISSILTLIDPDLLVLAGGLTGSGDFILKELKSHLNLRVKYPGYQLPTMVISSFGSQAGIEGGIALASENYL